MTPTSAHLSGVIQQLIDSAPDERAAKLQQSSYNAWIAKVDALIHSLGPEGAVFGRRFAEATAYSTYLERLQHEERRHAYSDIDPGPAWVYGWMREAVLGLLAGLQSALTKGLLTEIAIRVASDIYSDVLAEAEGLLKGNHLPCAAILSRVGLESGLRRLALRHGMPDAERALASALNVWLWKNGVYPKGTHDAVEGWIAPGNAYAHDKPEKTQYGHREIAKTIQDIRGFLGQHGV